MEHNRTSAAPAATPDEEKSLGELVRELTHDATQLLRQEMALVRAELKQSLQTMARGAGQMAAGGGLAAVGALVLLAFLIGVLGEWMGARYWLSALILGVLLLLVGGWLGFRALARLRQGSIAPEQTIATVRETGVWARSEVAELRNALGGGGGPGHNEHDFAATRYTPTAVPSTGMPSPTPPRARSGFGSVQAAGASGGKQIAGGWPGLLKRVWHEISDDDVSGQAAKVAYYAFLSFPPAFLVLFGLTGFFGGTGAADWITRELHNVLPSSASGLIDDFVQQVVHDKAPGPFSIGLLLALWASSNVFMALGEALNKAYDVQEDRSWVKRRAIALGVMLVSALLLLAGSIALIAGPAIAEALDLFGVVNLLWTVLRWPLTLLIVVGAFWVVYYALPNRDQSNEKKTLFKGAAAAALLWVLATAAFRIYIANFSSYSETYGFLGAVIVLLLWLYVTGLVILVGGEINAEIEHGPGATAPSH